MILFSILVMFMFIEGLTVFSQCFFNVYSKYSWTFDVEYDPSDNSNSSFHGEAEILNLLFL